MSSEDAVELSTALATARPYAAQFARFETWSHRATSVVDPAQNHHELAETLFAPLRNDQGVLAAWVDVTGKETWLSFPPKVALPNTHTWTRVRDQTLGWIRVAHHASCPVATPRGFRQVKDPACVLLARDDGRTASPSVVMAFIPPAEDR